MPVVNAGAGVGGGAGMNLNLGAPAVSAQGNLPQAQVNLPSADLRAPSGNLQAGLSVPKAELSVNAPRAEMHGPKVDVGAKVGDFVGGLFGGGKHKAKVELPSAGASLDVNAPKPEVQIAAPKVNLGAGAQAAAPKMVLYSHILRIIVTNTLSLSSRVFIFKG